jgi:hypothetical protein
MREDLNLKGVEQLGGRDLYASDGERLGTIDEIYYDRLSGVAAWFGFDTGLLPAKRLIVPVAGMSVEDDKVSIAYPSNVVAEQPEVELDDGLTSDAETLFSNYYGLGATST